MAKKPTFAERITVACYKSKYTVLTIVMESQEGLLNTYWGHCLAPIIIKYGNEPPP